VLGGALDWLRRVLDGETVPSGMTCFVMHEGWRELPAWPPPCSPYVLHLGDGALTTEPPVGGGVVVLRHDPGDPVPTRGGRVLGPFLPPPGPVDQRPVEARDDVAVFTSEPLVEALTVLGAVGAQLRVESTADSLDVAVRLCDVEPDGRSLHVLDSVARVQVAPGEAVTVDVGLGSTAYRFRTGHRVRLIVSGSNFPRFDVNPEQPAAHTLHLGPGTGSCLSLPVA
jgi:putative CocE/NonD family hydrolase